MSSEAQRKAVAKYDAENTMQVKIKLNRNTDADIIEHLKGIGSVQGYIKALIREDIKLASDPGEVTWEEIKNTL